MSCALLEVYFLKVRVCLPVEKPMFLKVMKCVHKSQSRECQLRTFYHWKLRFLKVQSQIKLERNCMVLVLEGLRHEDAILKNKN